VPACLMHIDQFAPRLAPRGQVGVATDSVELGIGRHPPGRRSESTGCECSARHRDTRIGTCSMAWRRYSLHRRLIMSSVETRSSASRFDSALRSGLDRLRTDSPTRREREATKRPVRTRCAARRKRVAHEGDFEAVHWINVRICVDDRPECYRYTATPNLSRRNSLPVTGPYVWAATSWLGARNAERSLSAARQYRRRLALAAKFREPPSHALAPSTPRSGHMWHKNEAELLG
jgi:hypothetical protein